MKKQLMKEYKKELETTLMIFGVLEQLNHYKKDQVAAIKLFIEQQIVRINELLEGAGD